MIDFKHAIFKVSNKLQTQIDDLSLSSKDLLVLLGCNGSGKTLISKSLALRYPLISGTAPQDLNTALVSFEDQQQLFEDDFKLRNNDNATLEEENGIAVASLFTNLDERIKQIVFDSLNIQPLLSKTIRQLSGGEGRRILIAKALCSIPKLLILDTPFDALDVELRQKLLNIIEDIHLNYDTAIVLVVNRVDEIPQSANKLGIIENLQIVKIDNKDKMLEDEDVKSLLYCQELTDINLPEPPVNTPYKADKNGNVFSLNKVNITYDRPILKNFSFNLKQGEHCLITGPNGAGKSTLLSLITGENPLVYQNDVTVFGYKRGSGESIWDIKKNYGLVSANLHLNYRVSSPTINVILSGFYDSIGLYKQCGDKERSVAMEWLNLIGLKDKAHTSFKQLSFGQQRLVLIARALVKKPSLLILDEPLQGLDPIARAMVKSYISYFMHHSKTSVLFVSHHKEDVPQGFNYEISFVRADDNSNNYNIVINKLQ